MMICTSKLPSQPALVDSDQSISRNMVTSIICTSSIYTSHQDLIMSDMYAAALR